MTMAQFSRDDILLYRGLEQGLYYLIYNLQLNPLSGLLQKDTCQW